MPTVPLIALKPHRYDGRVVRKGHAFLARSDDDARVLTMIGVARPALPPVAEPAKAPRPSDTPVAAPSVDPEPEPVPDTADLYPPLPDPLPPPPSAPPPAADAEDRPKRRYRRKDLAAEE